MDAPNGRPNTLLHHTCMPEVANGLLTLRGRGDRVTDAHPRHRDRGIHPDPALQLYDSFGLRDGG